MQATRVLRVAATSVVRANNELLAHAAPNLQKHWKSYTYTRNQRIRQLSPFELDVLGPLFRDIPAKIKHKVEDNFWDVAPPVIFFIALVQFVKWKRHQMLLEHRD